MCSAQTQTLPRRSRATGIRPGIQALLADAQGRQFDLVLAESLDRISRDQEDIAGVYGSNRPNSFRRIWV